MKIDRALIKNDGIIRLTAEGIPFGGQLLVRTEAGGVALLNETARWLWCALSDGASIGEATITYAERFTLALDDAARDVGRALREWEQQRLIERIPAEAMPAYPHRDRLSLDAIYRIGRCGVRVRCSVPSVARRIKGIFAPSRVGAGGDVANHLDLFHDGEQLAVGRNGRVVFRGPDAGYARGALLRELLRLSFPGQRWLACLHGAAVGNGSSCLVLAGDCGAGKSTLAVAAVRAGCTLLCDDSVPLAESDDRLARVWPLPFAVSLKEGSWVVAAEVFPEVAELPVHVTERGRVRYFFPRERAHASDAGGLPVRALVFPQYRPGAPLRFEPIDAADALRRLYANGSALDLSGYNLRHTLEWLERTPAYVLVYADLDATVARLKGLRAEH